MHFILRILYITLWIGAISINFATALPSQSYVICADVIAKFNEPFGISTYNSPLEKVLYTWIHEPDRKNYYPGTTYSIKNTTTTTSKQVFAEPVIKLVDTLTNFIKKHFFILSLGCLVIGGGIYYNNSVSL